MTIPHSLRNAHSLMAQDVLASLAAKGSGLGTRGASKRLAEHGPNRLPATPERSLILRFLSHFNNVLLYVLLAAAAVTAAPGHIVDTTVILAVVVANAVIGFVQEGRAEQAMSAIRHMLAPKTAVLRDGGRRTIDSADLVVGDVALLESGDRVPADLGLTEARVAHLRCRAALD